MFKIIYHNIIQYILNYLKIFQFMLLPIAMVVFIFLSKDAITNLLTKKQNIMQEYFEDYAIGYNLDDYYKKDALYIDTNKIFVDMSL